MNRFVQAAPFLVSLGVIGGGLITISVGTAAAGVAGTIMISLGLICLFCALAG